MCIHVPMWQALRICQCFVYMRYCVWMWMWGCFRLLGWWGACGAGTMRRNAADAECTSMGWSILARACRLADLPTHYVPLRNLIANDPHAQPSCMVGCANHIQSFHSTCDGAVDHGRPKLTHGAIAAVGPVAAGLPNLAAVGIFHHALFPTLST